MTRLTTMAAASHSISLAAMEEASRRGRRVADIDDMLLALTVDGGTAGQVLRSLGVTLDAARDAVAAQHTTQLADVGVGVSGGSTPDRIVFHETAAKYEWSPRALGILTRAGEKGRRGDAVAMLRELIDEPSGLIHSVLDRLGIDDGALHTALDEAERIPSHEPSPASDMNARSAASEVFVPAPVTDVWALLADPAGIAQWDSSIAAVDVDATQPLLVGAAWEARTRTARAYDGKALKVRDELLRQRVELTALSEGAMIAWRFTYPDASHGNARHVRFDISEAAGGTQLRIVFRWERDRAVRRRALGFLFRPLHRFVLWMQISQIGAAVSRAFR